MSEDLPTLVTAVFDLGRHTLSPPFRRDKDHYRDHLPAVLSIECPMVVYTDAAHLDLVQTLRAGLPTQVLEMDVGSLTNHEAYAEVHRIRADPRWLEQASWLPGSPQAALAGYNPVVLSKVLWLHDQSIANPFGSRRFYWIDAGLGHTVDPALLNDETLHRLTGIHDRFLLLAYPYAPDREVHGFDAAALARLAGVDRTCWVARGGLFGGAADVIDRVASRYDDLLAETLSAGLMGTEESLLTIMSYADAEWFDLQFLEADGRVEPLFASLEQGWPGGPAGSRNLLGRLCETWFISYNAPLQFERLLQSIEAADPALLRTARLALINNSTVAETFADYDRICARYGIDQVREGNSGVCGGRMRGAELFQRGGRHAMFWFEDDMLLAAEGEGGLCANGFPRYVHGLAETAVGALQREGADYIKLSFTEVFASHAVQAAWRAMGPLGRESYFPGQTIEPPTVFAAIRSVGHQPYAVGEVYYSNWPHLVHRRGARRLFFDERIEACSESYWMARSFELLRMGHLKSAVLLASPIDHRRTQDYGRYNRIEHGDNGRKAAALPEPASPRTRPEPPLEPGTIFVSIANYRDSETPHTIANLFANAARPDRLRVGVFSQVVPGDDDDCLPGPVPAGQLREIRAHASESLGACWARSRILEELLEGEEYVLQIDSHSRFEPGWDETLVDMLGRCPSPRAVLTTYPAAYRPPDERGEPLVTILAGDVFRGEGVLMVKARTLGPERPMPAPPPSAFLSANCLFAPAAALRQVPYDPWLYFHGEEISMAVRLWTHGWDLYAPDRCFMYHDYSDDRGRPRNWTDRTDWTALNGRSFARVRHLFGIETSRDAAVLRDFHRYGLGAERSLADYEAFADVTFVGSRVGPRAADARFPAAPDADRLRRSHAARARFADANEGATTHTPPLETRSGPRSTLRATAALRPALAAWLKANGVRRLVDAGCGDFNWMQAVDAGGLDLYVGYDVAPELIANNQLLYGADRPRLFATADIVTAPMVACDAVLCRDVLDGMTAAEVGRVLDNVRATGAAWLLAGDALDLGEPETVLPDGDRGLKVWRLR